ncbi:MAG: hypothetical protein SFY32_05360 [Bacteroidota bacterium]|nr:hypothetical protein [Bacteroidota bacterium]
MFISLKNIPGLRLHLPKGAFYFFPDVSAYFGKSNDEKTLKNSDDISMYLLNIVYLSSVPGNAFGYENCIRLSFAVADSKLIEGTKRLKEGLAKLK